MLSYALLLGATVRELKKSQFKIIEVNIHFKLLILCNRKFHRASKKQNKAIKQIFNSQPELVINTL